MSKDLSVLFLLFNRPDTRNALSEDIIDGLVEALIKADKDKDA